MEEINQPVSTSGPLQSTLPTPSTKAPRWLKIIVIGGVVVWLLALAGSVIYLVVTQKSSSKEVACTQEAKQCPDGSYVSRVGPNCVFAPCPTSTFDPTANLSRDEVLRDWKTYRNEEYGFEVRYPEEYSVEIKNDGIEIFSPRAMCEYTSFGSGTPVKQEESSRFMVFKLHSGVNYNDIWQKAFGFGLTREFSGEIVKNYDGESLIGGKKAKYFFQGAEMEFGRTAYLVEKSNTEAIEINSYVLATKLNCTPPLRDYPRNYPEIILSTFKFLDTSNFRKVKLFYYNRKLDPAFYCLTEAVIPVEREIPQTSTPIQDTIELLIEGKLTNEEIANGFSTEFPLHKDFRLRGATLENGILTLDFPDIYSYTDGGSCRTGLLNEQVKKTAKQFSEVKEVKYTSEEMFQP